MSQLWHFIVQAIFDLIVIAIMIFTTVDDLKTRKVRPVFQWLLLGVAIVHTVFVFIFADSWWVGASMIASCVLMFAIHVILLAIFKTGIGGADAKINSIMALYLGLIQAVVMIVVHAVAALLYVLGMKIAKKKTVASVRLMPFILIGFVVTKIIWWVTQAGAISALI